MNRIPKSAPSAKEMGMHLEMGEVNQEGISGRWLRACVCRVTEEALNWMHNAYAGIEFRENHPLEMHSMGFIMG